MFKDQFYKDLEQGKRGEAIVAQYLKTANIQVQDLSNDPQYYHKGDLLITLPTGEQRMVEVKNDTVIGTTGRILCEEEVFYKEGGYFKIGFMYNDYDIYVVVSEDTRQLYFLDFAKLKAIYKKYGQFKFFNYPTQSSDTYLVDLGRAKQFGALLAITKY